MKEIKVERLRNIPYVFNYRTETGIKRYEWSGSKNGKTDIKLLPEDAVNYLLMNSTCFKEGELRIIEDSEEAKEIVENIDDKESYKANTHTREEIIKLLNGNINTMKKEFSQITNQQEKLFILEIAKEIKLDSLSKQKVIADMLNTPVDILFLDDEDKEEAK